MKNKINIAVSLSTFAIITLAWGCGQAAPEKEVIVVPAQEPKTTVIIEKEAKPNSATITIDKKGG